MPTLRLYYQLKKFNRKSINMYKYFLKYRSKSWTGTRGDYSSHPAQQQVHDQVHDNQHQGHIGEVHEDKEHGHL